MAKNKYIMGNKTFPELEKSSFKGSLVSRSLETSGPEHNIFHGVREASEAVLLCKHYRREEPKRPKDFWDADSMHSALSLSSESTSEEIPVPYFKCVSFIITWTNWRAYRMQLFFASHKYIMFFWKCIWNYTKKKITHTKWTVNTDLLIYSQK